MQIGSVGYDYNRFFSLLRRENAIVIRTYEKRLAIGE